MRISTYPLIQYSQLIDCPVWDCHSGQLLGTVHQVWLDKQLHQVLGVTYRSLLNDGELGSLPWDQVMAVSSEGAWLNLSENTALIFQPKSTIHFQLGDEVWTNAGTLLGVLVDYCFEANTGEILQYQYIASESKRCCPQLMDLPARDLSYRGDRFQIEFTGDSRSPKQHGQHTIIDTASPPVASKPSRSLNSSHQNAYFLAKEFSLARTPLGIKTKNLVPS